MIDNIINDNNEKMKNLIKKFELEISKLKIGLANPSILSDVKVEYYGSKIPISQVSKINSVDGKSLFLKPYDKSLLNEICAVINKSDLGLHPQNNGDSIIINIPQLTQETRKLVIKKLHNIIEVYKVAIRKIRRDANQVIKSDKSLSINIQKDLEEKIQNLTDSKIKELVEISSKKEKQILTI